MEYSLFHPIGAFFCHQMPERSLNLNGHLLPLCSRCTGIYVGFFLSIIFQIPRTSLTVTLSWVRVVIFASIIIIFILIIDGLLGKLSLHDSTNDKRILLGLLGGSSFGKIIYPLFHLFITGKEYLATFIQPRLYFALWLVLALFYYMKFNLLGLFSIIGLFMFYILLSLTFSGMITNYSKETKRLEQNIYLIVCLFIILISQGYLINLLH